MDCDVGMLSSEIDVPKQQSVGNNPYLSVYPPKSDAGTELDTMGQENTWTDDEFLIPPAPENAIPLPPPGNVVEVTTSFEDSTPPTAPGLLDEFDSLFSPGIPSTDPQDDPLFEGNVVGVSGCEAGVCGLRNLGNTCFMNSGIQCLVVTAPLSVELTKIPPSPRRSLTNALCDLMRRIWSGHCHTIQPIPFKAALATHYPQFNDYRQHDCQEFLALLLDGLHEQLNTAGSKDCASQADSRDCCSPKNHKPLTFDQGDQSTSKDEDVKSEDETLLIRELVNEVSEKQKKCNLDKGTQLGEFASSDGSSEPSPEALLPGTSSGKMDNLDECRQLNNRQPLLPSAAIKEDIPVVINQVQRINGIDDIVKKGKTSNVNVLVTKEESNNEIRFDSEKYPRNRFDSYYNRINDRYNINTFQHDNNTYGKRNSSLSSLPFSLDVHEGLDLKRIKRQTNSEDVEDKNRKMELERRQNSPDMFLEKNERMECERKESKDDILCDPLGSSLLSPNFADIRIDKTSEVEADTHWQKHLEENKSVVVNTFQGQFKSTVVCSVCKYLSVTYEPFMYLSVPLPNAMQKRLTVTFIGESLKQPTEFLLELNKYDTVSYLRDQILLKVGCEVKGPIIIAEVFNHHLSKFLEEHLLIQNLNDSGRSLYAFEVTTLMDKTTVEPIEDKVEEYLVATSCIICLEDKDANMKHHEECTCILCDTCIADSRAHYCTSSFNCPVCRKNIDPDKDMKPVKVQPSSSSRMINIPIVFRVDTVGDGNNNQNHVELFGHPMVIRVPSVCSSEALHKELASVLHYKEPFRLLLVSGQGLNCSRCLFHVHCRGCELPSEVTFSNSDSLAVVFSGPVVPVTTCPPLALLSSQSSSLTLYDCIQAFSQSEVLDGNNPWFCPQCKQNRCATKTLSVWRYPDYLIIYLKRFVFHNHISTKLEEKVLFPLTGLSLASGSDYDLYACVCHIGGVSAGHYTTYAQHPYTGEWHYFNDGHFCKQSPVEDDYSNAYILFYKKQGLQPPPMEIRMFRQEDS